MKHLARGRTILLADVTFQDRPGGSERLVDLVASALASHGNPVAIVAGSPRGWQEWQEGPVVHSRFPVRMRRNTLLCWDAWRGSRRWATDLRDRRVVGFHPSSTLGCHQGTKGKVPVAHFFFTPVYREWLCQVGRSVVRAPADVLVAWALRRVQRGALEASRVVFVLGRYSQRLLRREFPQVPRVVLLRPSVDLVRFGFAPDVAPARERLGLSPNDFVLLTVRRLVPRTGVLRLVEAMALLRERHVRLLIVGDGPQRQTIEATVEHLELGETVTVLGHVNDADLPLYYQAADLSLIPSVGLEAFGLVVLESLASGTPVAGTPVGEVPDAIEPLSKRLTLPGVSADEIAHGLASLLQRDFLRDLRAPARRLVEEQYSPDQMAHRLLSVLGQWS
jgi:glycosyltransferase involved in cell wall biosynthesis